MQDDSRVFEIYVEFIVKSMNELDNLSVQERELLQKSNVINKKKNQQLILRGYNDYKVKLYLEWERIYSKSTHFAETHDSFVLLNSRKTLYAVTLPQRFVEQFFFHLDLALRAHLNSCAEKNRKPTDWVLTDSMEFNYVESIMKDFLPVVLLAIKDHKFSIDGNIQKAFMEMNLRHIRDGSLQYQKGQELSSTRIDQIISDMEEHAKREEAKWKEGINNHTVKVDFRILYSLEDLEEVLERGSCGLLAWKLCGSAAYYDVLPKIPIIDSYDFDGILDEIDSHIRKVQFSANDMLEQVETSAMYLGIIAGYAFLNSIPMNSEMVREQFLKKSNLPVDVPDTVLSFTGIAADSGVALKINEVAEEMKKRYGLLSVSLVYKKTQVSKELSKTVAKTAFKLGYNAYFRMNKLLPGNTCEEDQIILNQMIKRHNNPPANSVPSSVARTVENRITDNKAQGTTSVISSQRHKAQEEKYWLDKNGKVRCPGDACPIDCDVNCPIYAQTMAMAKLQNNDFEAAAKLLRNAVATEPSFADAWNNLAACYGQMGDHKNAFAAYQRSYEIQQKPNPLFGMSVATKNMKDYDLAKFYTDLYVKKFGADERIKSLIAEISENELSAKVGEKNVETHDEPNTSQPLKKQDVPVPASSPAIEPPVKSAAVPPQNNKEPDMPLEDMHRFGKFVLLLLDEDTREAGYAGFEKMIDQYPEACILLGQYYNGIDVAKAKSIFKKAADKEIAEAQWDYSQLLPHSEILDFITASDREYLKYCLAAAEGGCPDAANEMGNICHREEFYEEATYWYGMAYSLEHPAGLDSLKGITEEWRQKGISSNFVAHIDGFTEERRATSLILYRMFNQSLETQDLDDLMKLALKGENLAGFILGQIMEQGNHEDMAYKVYNALAFENHPHALRCYADMLLNGKGTTKDIEGAFMMYEMAALRGNAVSMFAMGQKAVKDGDKNLAACWFGQAYSRGFEMAAEWLSGLK